MKVKIFPYIALIIFLAGLFVYPESRFITLFIGEEKFIVEIADDYEKRAVGLMFRKDIPDNFGMLFVYAEEDYRGMWMKNTLINLDLIFMDSSKEIIDIIPDVPPCKADPCQTYVSKEKARYVLELKGGRSESLGLKKGSRIYFIL
jgi:uncharacterized membrane protein (UPF0127 family)